MMNFQPQQTQPDLKILTQHPAHFISLGFGSGLSPVAPGTAGTLLAWLTFNLFLIWIYFLSPLALGIIIACSFVLGLWACQITAAQLRAPDPGFIVWDEVVAFWLILACVPITSFVTTFVLQCIAFILFRLFDAVKKGPVQWADQAFKGEGYTGAFGIMFDDFIAALITIAIIQVGAWVFI